MISLVTIAKILCAILGVLLVGGIVWNVHPYKIGNKLYHDLFGWHKPSDEITYDSCNVHSHCKFCGKHIMQDSQGNWFAD